MIGLAGAFAVWVNRQALNTSNWFSTSSQILENKQVQTALSAYLCMSCSRRSMSREICRTCYQAAAAVFGPAAAGLQQLAGQLAPRVLASPQVLAVGVQANIAAHKELLKVLNGGGPDVSTQSGVVTLNLHTLVRQLAATLGISSQVAAVQSMLQGSGRVGPRCGSTRWAPKSEGAASDPSLGVLDHGRNRDDRDRVGSGSQR